MPSRQERSSLLAAFGAIFAIFALSVQPVASDDSLRDREILGYEVHGSSGVVSYSYAGDELPTLIVPDEIPSMRTETSYTRYLGTRREGEELREMYQVIAYSKPTYAKVGSAWYVREHATTTLASLNRALEGNPLARLLTARAYADSISPFSGAGDGYTYHTESGDSENPITFSDCDGNFGVNGAIAFPTGVNATFGSLVSGPIASRICEIDRAFLPFNTSSISSSATISAATLNLYVVSKANGVNDGNDTGVLIQTNQASSATLADTDHTHVDVTAGATSLDITSVTTSAYNVWTLNATGISWIKKSGETAVCGSTAGFTCLGMREGHDIVGAITQNLNGDFITFSTSEETGTAQDPYLSVTYSVPASPVRTIYLLGNVYLRGVWLY